MAVTLNLLPGWGFRATVWEGLLPLIEAPWTPHPIDLPWHQDPLEWTQPDGPLAQALRPGWILGWSLGGTLGLALAERDDIRGVVLLASTPHWVNHPDWASGLDPVQLDELQGQLNDEPQAALRHFSALVALGSRQPARLRSALQHHQLPADTAPLLSRALDLLRALDLRRASPRARIVAIDGGGDRLLPNRLSAGWLASVGSPPAGVLPETGHAPQLSDPAALARALSDIDPG
jgi:pimeloyl-[acyl-carrier protein] methyl ester esterase